ncbi:DUF4172 domain-containing protein [Proteus mirabilis]|uniref:Fic family protein n=1 Tax=Proteus TaxID=583 RepID=UPI000B4E7F9C|nr:Fic family protein [Proteus genomosp. 4]PNL49183.1 DUF4172 domain-containing protein [Proteus mirabilis]
MWIWQHSNWTHFRFNNSTVIPLLIDTRFVQGMLYGQSQMLPENSTSALDSILANIIYSSDIEGEKLNAFSVRSSLATRLGIVEEKTYPTDEKSEGFVQAALDAINNLDEPLTHERLFQWHNLLFPEGHSILNPITSGKYRTGIVQVVSGKRIDKPIVHFEAPPPESIETEMALFLDWFNKTRVHYEPDLIIRAAIAHLWFLTIHPFEDGNGRIGRLIMDLALAQAENKTVRLYAMSKTINEHRQEYYDIIENTQKGDGDITLWLQWFLQMLQLSILEATHEIDKTVRATKYWQTHDQALLSPEQSKVINRMLQGDFVDGINNSQYKSVAKVSRASATRHLAFLVEQGFLADSGAGGRSVRYILQD